MTDDELASVAGTGHICPVSTGDENSSRERLAQLAPRNALAIGDRCPLSAICYLLFTTVAIRSSHGCPHSITSLCEKLADGHKYIQRHSALLVCTPRHYERIYDF